MTVYALDGLAPELPDAGLCWIAPCAAVIGRVRLERDASVWFGAVLRGDIEWITVGARSNVQDGCVLHTEEGQPLLIGEGCTIGHKALLHGCTIGDGALVGMGATVMNGARIGANAIVGAGALVQEGRDIPEGVLAVGSPARVVRRLGAEELAACARAADHYVAAYRRFAAGLIAL